MVTIHGLLKGIQMTFLLLLRSNELYSRLYASANMLIKAVCEVTAEVDVFHQFDLHAIPKLFSVKQEPERVISHEAPE